MKVGDLVKIKYDGVVALVTRIEFAPNFYKSIAKPTEWVFLSGQDMPFRPHKLEWAKTNFLLSGNLAILIGVYLLCWRW